MKINKSFIAFLLVISVFSVGIAHAENAQTVTIGSQQIRLGQTSDEVSRLVKGSWALKNSNWTYGVWDTLLDGVDDDGTNLIKGKFYYVG